MIKSIEPVYWMCFGKRIDTEVVLTYCYFEDCGGVLFIRYHNGFRFYPTRHVNPFIINHTIKVGDDYE